MVTITCNTASLMSSADMWPSASQSKDSKQSLACSSGRNICKSSSSMCSLQACMRKSLSKTPIFYPYISSNFEGFNHSLLWDIRTSGTLLFKSMRPLYSPEHAFPKVCASSHLSKLALQFQKR